MSWPGQCCSPDQAPQPGPAGDTSRETLCTSIAAIHAGLLVSVHIFTVLRHQVGPAQGVDVAYGGMDFIESDLEGLVVHVYPVTWIAAGTPVVFGGGGVEVPVLLQIGNIGEWAADIHVVLDIVPQRKVFVDIVTLVYKVSKVDADIPIAVREVEHVQRQTLPIRAADDVRIELMKGCGEFPYGAVLLVLAVIVVIKDGDHAGLAVEFPEWATGGADPEFGEFVDDECGDAPHQQRRCAEDDKRFFEE